MQRVGHEPHIVLIVKGKHDMRYRLGWQSTYLGIGLSEAGVCAPGMLTFDD